MLATYDHDLQLHYDRLSRLLSMRVMMKSLKSPTSLLCAFSRYLAAEADICSSWRTSVMTTFHVFGTIEWCKSCNCVTRFLGDAPMAQVCQDSGLHPLHARSPRAHPWVPISASIKELRPRRSASRRPQDLSRRGGYECDECSHATIHCKTLYMYSLLIPIRAFPSEGRTLWVRRYCNLARVLMRILLSVPPCTYMYAQ
jgi:hypothetical protein